MTEFSGAMYAQGLHSLSQELWADERYNVNYDFVTDLSKCRINLSGAEMFQIMKLFSITMPAMKGKGSIIVPNSFYMSVGLLLFNNSPLSNMNKIYVDPIKAFKEKGLTPDFQKLLDNEKIATVKEINP